MELRIMDIDSDNPSPLNIVKEYSNALANLRFEEAQKIADSGKALTDPAQCTAGFWLLWRRLFESLGLLCTCEKLYYNMKFHHLNKVTVLFGHRPGSVYAPVIESLEKVLENIGNENSTATAKSQESHFLPSHLAKQLLEYIDMKNRLAVMVYWPFRQEKKRVLIVSNSIVRNTNLDDGLIKISVTDFEETFTNLSTKFHHPAFCSLQSAFEKELEIVRCLLKCHWNLNKLEFLNTLLALKDSQRLLKDWIKNLPLEKPSTTSYTWLKFGTASTPTPTIPQLCAWLQGYYEALMAKFSLLFHNVLSKPSTPQEFRTYFLSKLKNNLQSKLLNFQKNHDVHVIALCLDASKDPSLLNKAKGFTLPSTTGSVPYEQALYPILFANPSDCKFVMESTIAEIMLEKGDWVTTDKSLCIQRNTKPQTIYLRRIEQQLFLVVAYTYKRGEKDGQVEKFFAETSSSMCPVHFVNMYCKIKGN